MDRRHSIPIPLLPDQTVALMLRLTLDRRLRRRFYREAEIRRGSDRSGPRIPVAADEWLAAQEDR